MRNKVELKNGVTLEIGKKYTHATWTKDEIYEVTAIGETIFVYKPKDCDYELTHEIDNDWIPYEEPKTEKWYKVLMVDSDSLYDVPVYMRQSDFDNLNEPFLKEYSSKEEMIEDLKK
jgi:hypothetical protein